ncbi:MAG: hypothetical protein LIO76_09720 [Clostridiales bacterium]|nr:hypothetical protein [Clostridiales bacterium]
MKRKQRRLLALLLACMMMCIPAAQVMAASAYDVTSEELAGAVLFPGDSLTGIAEGTVITGTDGTQTTADGSGTWKNETEDKAVTASYTAGTEAVIAIAGDGSEVVESEAVPASIQMTLAGYVLIVVDGTSETALTDGTGTTGNHYEFTDEEKTALAAEDTTKDIAYYTQGESVKITAAAPAEGYVFAGWTVEAGDGVTVTVADASSAETTLVMPNGKVTVTASYTQETEAVTEAATEETEATEATGATEAAAAAVADDNNVVVVDETDAAAATDDNGIMVASEENLTTTDVNAAAETTYTYTLTKQYKYGDSLSGETETEIQTVSAAEYSCTVTAAEKEGYTFDSWTVVGYEGTSEAPVIEASASDPLSATVTVKAAASDAAVTVQANYTEITKYTLTLENCTADASSYAEGATVTITPAAASTGYVLSGVTVLDSTGTAITSVLQNDGTYTFTMPAGNVTVSAVYTAASYNVTVVNGTLSTSGTAAAESAACAYGTTVTITAAALEGKTFDHWESTGTAATAEFADGDAETTSFVMPAGDVEVTAVYNVNTYTVKVSSGLIDNTYSENTYEEGTQITVTANAAASGNEFSGWTVNDGAYDLGDSASDTSVTVIVDQDLSFVANYTGIQYNVIVTSGSADYTEAVAGTTVTITADTPATGYEFDSWTVGTQNVTLANASKSTTTFTMPSADVSVTANYKKVQYSVTVENGNANATYFYYGDTVTISSNYPASGKVFSAWTATSGNVTFADASKASTTFTMPASNVTISATYEDAPTGADNYISGIEEGGSYVANEKLTFTPVGAGMSITDPNPGDVRYVPTGYTIGNVSNTWSSAPYETSMSIKKTGEYTLTVTFARQVYDGSSWVADGTTTTTSVTFNIVESLESVQTGDDTPIMQVVAIAAVACLIFLVLLVVFIRRRRRDE